MAHSTCALSRCLRAGSVVLLVGAAAAAAETPHVEFSNGVFKLIPWTGGSTAPAAGWESVLSVYAGAGDTPMLGAYTVEGDALEFHPRFPLTPGLGYHGVFKGGGFVMDPPPQRIVATTRIERVYPSTDVLPANTLRLYIYFSAPMGQGEAWRHIHLRDDSGNEVPDAFLDQELWDPDNRRLTVLFDPGRIKRGLASTDPPLLPGKRYTLTIDLAEGFRKSFTAGPADRTPVDPKSWRLTPPKAGTVEPLAVEFPRPLDYALLQHTLEVPGVRGTIIVDRGETRWSFTPNAPWIRGEYRLVAQNTLEDVAGNRPGRAFDVDGSASNHPAATVSLPFRVR